MDRPKNKMFLGRLIPGLSGEWIQSDRKGLAGGFMGQDLKAGSSCGGGRIGDGSDREIRELLDAYFQPLSW